MLKILENLTINSSSIFPKDCEGACSICSDDNDHPNKTPFRGTLLIVDEPSNRPPNGSDGHKILVPKDIAKKNLKSLIGMGVNYQPSTLSSHAPKHKVGVISSAWIDGSKVIVDGHIFTKDFPEAKHDLKKPGLGMSMELANVLVKNKSDPIWKLIDFHFTGATILFKNSAAYSKTALAAAAEQVITLIGGMVMSDKKRSKKTPSGTVSSKQLGNLVTLFSSSVAKAMTDGLKPFGKKLDTLVASSSKTHDALTTLAASQATATMESSEKDSIDAEAESGESATNESDELTAAAKKKGASSSSSSSESSMESGAMDSTPTMRSAKKKQSSSSSSSSESDDSDLDAELATLSKKMSNSLAAPDDTGEESSDAEVGKLNERAKNKGRKNQVSASSGVHQVVQIAAKATKRIDSLKAQTGKLRKSVREERRSRKDLEAQVEEMQAQIEEFTNNQTPKAVTSDLRMLLAKGGNDINELMAGGRVMTVGEVDEMFASSGLALKPEERIAFKNQLLEKGWMEQGEMVPAHLRGR